MKNQQGLQGAQRLFLIQLGITGLIAVIAAVISGTIALLSALLGGLVCVIPNVFFARMLFQHQGASAVKQIINRFYVGEALKIVLSVMLFALVFVFFKILPLVFFTVYLVVQLVFWFAPLIFVNR